MSDNADVPDGKQGQGQSQAQAQDETTTTSTNVANGDALVGPPTANPPSAFAGLTPASNPVSTLGAAAGHRVATGRVSKNTSAPKLGNLFALHTDKDGKVVTTAKGATVSITLFLMCSPPLSLPP